MYNNMLAIKFSIGRSLRCAIRGITSKAKGVRTMLASESTRVMTAPNAKRVLALRMYCKAIGVPGMAANSRMPILASGVSGKSFTKRKPILGIRTQFASNVRVNRARLPKTSSSSPAVDTQPYREHHQNDEEVEQ
jgi:hypothetical protein